MSYTRKSPAKSGSSNAGKNKGRATRPKPTSSWRTILLLQEKILHVETRLAQLEEFISPLKAVRSKGEVNLDEVEPV